MGLLDYIASTSLDADYARASRMRGAPDARTAGGPAGPTHRMRPGGRTLVVLAVFGALVATAAVQTSRDAPQSATSRETLVKQADARKDDLNRRRTLVRVLQDQIATLQTSSLEETARGRAVQQQLTRLGVLTGSQPTRGPGVEVRVDDAPGATTPERQVQSQDLQKLVNALWTVGAEAISINGQRVTSLTPIRDAAGAVTVDFRSLSRPYSVSAIGNPQDMGARLLDTEGGRVWVTLQSNFGLQFDVEVKDSMQLPAARRLTLRHAHEPGGRR
jgi:uncharacterized protein YlxW (UPF0749 family)